MNSGTRSFTEKLEPISKIFLIHAAAVLICSNFVRAYLISSTAPKFDWVLFSLPIGFAFDLCVSVYTFLPFVLLFLLPARILSTRFSRFINTLLFLDFAILTFLACCEFIFFDEFRDRFNFIAVDYLVYTHEVLENVWESYPVIAIVSGVCLIAAAGSWLINRASALPNYATLDWRGKAAVVCVYAGAVAGLSFAISEQSILKRAQPIEELLSKNGLYSLFAAYHLNEIDFDRFYTGIDAKIAAENVHELLEGTYETKEDHSTEDEQSIVRNIEAPRPLKRLNVILVVMESLSARYMEHFGNPENLTPNLDRIAKHSLFFNRHYATGTRTVRGLEAVLLSVPPTPGQSILRRPAGVGIFNLGQIFQENGYASNFVYGGRARFDNMSDFFEGNGYTVTDQTYFDEDEITFSNAWGVCDEDLFKKVIKLSDRHYQNGESFFSVVLTTSNHRPYTFPAGRVERKSGSGRLAAIQYSDYAIGSFIDEARNKPWFSSTIFVFVADHNAAVSGGTTVLPEDYLVPLLIFSPDNIMPNLNSKLSSQIDIAPTLLSLMNFSYQSRFFGMDLMTEDPSRAFLSTYQKISYLDENSLTTLSPNRIVETSSWRNGTLDRETKTKIERVGQSNNKELLTTVAYYKVASDWFRTKRLETGRKYSDEINKRR